MRATCVAVALVATVVGCGQQSGLSSAGPRTTTTTTVEQKPKPAPVCAMPRDFKLGLVCYLANDQRNWLFDVQQIYDANRMRVVLKGDPNLPFVVKGFPTKGVVDNQQIELPGVWEVTGTVKTKNGRTLFQVEPVK